MTAHEVQRWSLWLHWCEHAAVLPWVQAVQRVAKANNDAHEYFHALGMHAHLERQWQDINDQLWALDPAWSQEVLAWRPRPRQPDGALEEAERRAWAREYGSSADGLTNID